MEVYEWSPCNDSGGIFRWKRSSGISVHQYISPNSTDLTQFTVSRVLLFKGIHLPIPVMSGGKELMKLLKIGL